MDHITAVAQVVVPIFLAIFLGMYSRRKQLLTREQNSGFQQYVMKFGLPCVLFNSCLTASFGAESVGSMAMAFSAVTLAALWAYRFGKKKYPHHNLPMLFAAQESGMLGIPLVMVLFGADQAFRMGVLDLGQNLTACLVISVLSVNAGASPSPGKIVKGLVTSPFLLMSLLGLTLNLTGAADWLNAVGIGGILTAASSFIAQPVSAAMLFSVGYNFSMAGNARDRVLRLAGIHFAMYAVFGAVFQLLMCLIPGVELIDRLVMLIYCTLPSSYLAPTLGRSQDDYTVASGVCSMLTVVSLLVFCVVSVMAL